jgi:hypothetical protein
MKQFAQTSKRIKPQNWQHQLHIVCSSAARWYYHSDDLSISYVRQCWKKKSWWRQGNKMASTAMAPPPTFRPRLYSPYHAKGNTSPAFHFPVSIETCGRHSTAIMTSLGKSNLWYYTANWQFRHFSLISLDQAPFATSIQFRHTSESLRGERHILHRMEWTAMFT